MNSTGYNLVEDLVALRAERPDEWQMTRFIHEAVALQRLANSRLESKLHPSVVKMALAMQEKLDKNAHKDGGPTENGKRGWLNPNCTVEFLIHKMNEETRELRYAARRDNLHMTSRLEDVRLEAADVANIAMMIADNIGCYTNE